MTESHKLRVFLCHASQDRPAVRELLQRLNAEAWIDAWLHDEVEETGGKRRDHKIQDWLEDTAVILACFSRNSLTADGGLSHEMSEFLDVAEWRYKQPVVLVAIRKLPVLVIPVRLDDCPIPSRFKRQTILDLPSDDFEAHCQDLLRELRVRGKEHELQRDEERNREIRRIERIVSIMSFVLKIRDLIEQRPFLLRTKLRVLILHPNQDTEAAGTILVRLQSNRWIDAQLGEEQSGSAVDWEQKIYKTLRQTDVILLCLSASSSSHDGFYEPRFADPWRKAKDKYREKILILPIRLDDFVPKPEFQMWRWLDYFADRGPGQLLDSLQTVARMLGVLRFRFSFGSSEKAATEKARVGQTELHEFIPFSMPSGEYSYWISRQPVTCSQFEQFLRAPDYNDSNYWKGFSKYDAKCKYLGEWDPRELEWLDEFRQGDRSKQNRYHWSDLNFRLARPLDYARRISWYESNAFCKWLTVHWRELPEFNHLQGSESLSRALQFRLPLRTEWIHAVKTGKTLPPRNYHGSNLPPGVVQVPHSIHEWFLNLSGNDQLSLNRYYGEMFVDENLADMARMGYDFSTNPWDISENNCFRLVVIDSR